MTAFEGAVAVVTGAAGGSGAGLLDTVGSRPETVVAAGLHAAARLAGVASARLR